MPKLLLIKNCACFSLKVSITSVAFSIISGHLIIPNLFRINSVILPIEGTFLMSSFYINLSISSLLGFRNVWPLGLFISEQILANNLFGAMPALHVILVASLIFLRIS